MRRIAALLSISVALAVFLATEHGRDMSALKAPCGRRRGSCPARGAGSDRPSARAPTNPRWSCMWPRRGARAAQRGDSGAGASPAGTDWIGVYAVRRPVGR